MLKKVISFGGLVFAASLAAGCAIEAPTEAAVAAPAADGSTQLVSADGKPVKYCQTDTDTGSHLRQKTVCLTEEQERDQRQSIEQGRSFRRGSSGGGGS